MNILALDPGTVQTGYCVVSNDMRVIDHGILNNQYILPLVRDSQADNLAIEMIASYGMPVGKEVFETCVWIGRFIQSWREPDQAMIVYRKDVKMHLCGSTKAKDGNIRQAIIDLYPATGGGATPQIGTKGSPGPLYGVSSHVWPALGVALVAHNRVGRIKFPDQIPLYSGIVVPAAEMPF
jgi:hypothetical protein